MSSKGQQKKAKIGTGLTDIVRGAAIGPTGKQHHLLKWVLDELRRRDQAASILTQLGAGAREHLGSYLVCQTTRTEIIEALDTMPRLVQERESMQIASRMTIVGNITRLLDGLRQFNTAGVFKEEESGSAAEQGDTKAATDVMTLGSGEEEEGDQKPRAKEAPGPAGQQQGDHVGSDPSPPPTLTTSCSLCGDVTADYGPRYSYDKGLCFQCMTEAQDPFHTVLYTLAGPFATAQKRSKAELTVGFRLQRPLAEGDGVWVRSFRLEHTTYQRKQHHPAMARLPPHTWPLNSTLTINGQAVKIEQGAWTEVGNGQVFKGESQAVEVKDKLNLNGVGSLKLMYVDQALYWVVVQVRRKASVDNVVQACLESAKRLSVDEGRAAFAEAAAGRRIGSSGGGMANMGERREDEVQFLGVNGSLRLSLRCVFTHQLPTQSARGILCSHLECFDLDPLVRSLVKRPGKYHCPKCMAPLSLNELVVDEYVQDIVTKVKDLKYKKNKNKDKKSKDEEDEIEEDEIDTIEVQENGDWAPDGGWGEVEGWGEVGLEKEQPHKKQKLGEGGTADGNGPGN